MSTRKTQTKRISLDWKKVGRRVRELRGFDMRQVELAEQIGISQGYLSTVEQGEREIGAEVLLAIARHFGKSIEWLLTGEE
jgi:transcriptional regulator with XRE-family HTH domain